MPMNYDTGTEGKIEKNKERGRERVRERKKERRRVKEILRFNETQDPALTHADTIT